MSTSPAGASDSQEAPPPRAAAPAERTPDAPLQQVITVTGTVSPAPQSAVPQTKPAEDKTAKAAPLNDLSSLFARQTTEVSKSGKLAEQMPEINVNDLLSQSLGLARRLKKK
jgi:hypothetical protein